MKRHEREAILDRVDREGATVGAEIPDRLEIDGSDLALRDRVLAFHRPETLDDDEEAALQRLLVTLRGERRRRLERLESELDLDRDTAEHLASSVIGIDRALASLSAVADDDDIEAEIRQQQLADSERWRHFIKKAGTSDIDRGLPR